MCKAILVGNGFTSQLINEYKNEYMLKMFKKALPAHYKELNCRFQPFRKYSENSFTNNKDFETQIRNKLKKMSLSRGFYDKYFIMYGLRFEVPKKSISSIESLLKISNMFNYEYDKEIRQVANKIYFNNGNYDLSATDLKDYSKAREFFNNYEYIFTTNYDLVLDDLCNHKDIFHLHGGFNIKRDNDGGKINYIKTKNKLCFNEAYLIWGISGGEKIKNMKAGIFFPFKLPIYFPYSIFYTYLDYLGKKEIQEIHILGYSGENDQHINEKIRKNPNIKKIVYYCNPKCELDNYDFKNRMSELFLGKVVVFVSWDKTWEQIR